MRAAVRERCLAIAVVVAAGCSGTPYAPRPLDPDALAADAAARSASSDGLKRFVLANGYEEKAWPPARWGLRELSLTAWYFHPDLRTARARAEIARAEFGSPAAPSMAAVVRPAYHDRTLPEDDGPWTLGLELEIPLVAHARRTARAERNAFLADAAELDVAAAGWSVRARVRDRFLDLQASRDALALAESQLAARREMLALVARRVEAGIASARELGAERVMVAQTELATDQESTRYRRELGALAAAIGLPLEATAAMALNFDAEPAAGTGADAVEIRRLALHNRLDVHRKLLEFGAADAEVKFAVASQNPDIRLGPGYAWDQGDNVWSLAVGFSVPPAIQARAAIRAAQARRDLAAEQFAATQSAAIAAAGAAAAQVRTAQQWAVSATRQWQAQREQQAGVERRFEGGAADRMELVAARLGTLSATAIKNAAFAEQRRALAELEDAVQRPLFGDFGSLPDLRAARNDRVSGP